MGRMAKPLEDILNSLSTSNIALCRAAKEGNQRLVRKELKNGADPDELDARGWAAVHYAAAEGHGGVLHDLARHGANMHLPASGDYHPIHFAFQGRHRRLAKRWDQMFPRREPEATPAPASRLVPEPAPEAF